jgi:restriction system protein
VLGQEGSIEAAELRLDAEETGADAGAPSVVDLLQPLLNYLADGKVHHVGDVTHALNEHFQLPEEVRNRRLPSGALLMENRVRWARVLLTKAALAGC